MSNDTQHTPNIMARLFFEKSFVPRGLFFVPRGLSSFFAALEALRPLRTFGPLCPGEAAGTASRSTEAVIAATAAFLQLRLTPVARARPSFSEANKTSLFLSIFSLEYIYLLYSLFLMLLLVACWTSVGCLLDVCWMSVECLLFGVLDGCSGVLLTCIFIGTYECYF